MKLLPYLLVICSVLSSARAESIDRQAVVGRHNPALRTIDWDAPVTIGNGAFAFSTDVTGLQTFAAQHHRLGVPTETLARWAWYTEPNPHGYELPDAFEDYTQADGRVVAYPTKASGESGQWLRRNPRIHPLGQLAFVHVDGSSQLVELDRRGGDREQEARRNCQVSPKMAVGRYATKGSIGCRSWWSELSLYLRQTSPA